MKKIGGFKSTALKGFNKNITKSNFKRGKIGSGSFSGPIKKSTSDPPYVDGTQGLFIKSIKGMPGKHYLQKAFEATEAEMNNG